MRVLFYVLIILTPDHILSKIADLSKFKKKNEKKGEIESNF